MSAALRYPPLPSLRKTQHMLSVTVPGFDDCLTVHLTASGSRDQPAIESIDNVFADTVALETDKIWLRKPGLYCAGSKTDFFTLEEWLVAEIHDEQMDEIRAGREGVE